MKIAFCAAEAIPFAKVGGLGDVVSGLSKALAALGETLLICLPRYGGIDPDEHHLVETGVHFVVRHLGTAYPIQVLKSSLPGTDVPVYFLDQPELYGRSTAVYPSERPVFEALRFDVLSLGFFELLKQLDFQPDILHVHDWHTAMVARHLKTRFKTDPFFAQTRSVLSIHNMAYQGITDHLNRLREGLLASDRLVAVSANYAQEILLHPHGAGLEDLLQAHQAKLCGILNGLDTDLFNPQTDRFLSSPYNPETVQMGKSKCKADLQHRVGLPEQGDRPVFGMVTRLVDQKGIDLLLALLPVLSTLPLQLVILGGGDAEYEQLLQEANQRYNNIRTVIGFHLALGQQVYGGADLFLMPSQFEPCGLGQLIALRYGTIPIVRKTGGLADTVIDREEDPDNGNGFVFEPYTPEAFLTAIQRGLETWNTLGSDWWPWVRRAMSQDFSWQASAEQYRQLYQELL